MTIISKLKNLNLKKNCVNLKLRESLERAKIYLSIIESIEGTRKITKGPRKLVTSKLQAVG